MVESGRFNGKLDFFFFLIFLSWGWCRRNIQIMSRIANGSSSGEYYCAFLATCLLGFHIILKSFILMVVLDVKVKGATKNIRVHPLGTMNIHSKCHGSSVICFGNILLWRDRLINTPILSFYPTDYKGLKKKTVQHSAESITLTHIAQPLRWTPPRSL